LERLRGQEVVMAERLPTGELVLMTRQVLVEHVQAERRRNIGLGDVERLIREPDAIYDDRRPVHGARDKYYAMRLKPDPYGKVKVKKLIAHLKSCRKLLLFRVSFVSTVILSRKLPPQAKLRWKGAAKIL
jgi:hypothetical protein